MQRLLSNLAILFWGGVIFILTRQVPFASLSALGNVSLLLLLLVSLPAILRKSLTDFGLIGLFILTLILYSVLFTDNQLNLIVRFALIVGFVLLAYFITLDGKKALRWLFAISLLHCLVVIGLEAAVMRMDEAAARGIRAFFIEKTWGDIYPYFGSIYKIQIKGNAILPFVYMLSWMVDIFPRRGRALLRIIFLTAIFLAGNFAFILGIAAFHLYFAAKKALASRRVLFNTLIIAAVLAAAVGVPVSRYLSETIAGKNDYSNPTRVDQVEVLWRDLNANGATLVFGRGLGNTADIVGRERDYTGNIYFEIQSMYILNQLGLLGFAVFAALNVYLSIKKIKYRNLIGIYLIYIFYAFFNPYMIDTTQVVVIVALIAAKNMIDEKNKLHSGALQS